MWEHTHGGVRRQFQGLIVSFYSMVPRDHSQVLKLATRVISLAHRKLLDILETISRESLVASIVTVGGERTYIHTILKLPLLCTEGDQSCKATLFISNFYSTFLKDEINYLHDVHTQTLFICELKGELYFEAESELSGWVHFCNYALILTQHFLVARAEQSRSSSLSSCFSLRKRKAC